MQTGERTPGDLLTNGDMDQLGFYWRPPNHWIAGGWFEWFSTKPFNFPEFSDGNERSFIHTRPSSQRLQLWGHDYAGGLMQSAKVTPCAYYQFVAYGQSRPGSVNPPPVNVESHMKVGIEPYGWMSGRSIYQYNPGMEPEDFPGTVIWSPEATHNFVFAPYTVAAEALSSTVTVILSSYPEVDPRRGVWWNDTVWDSASLVEVAPPSGTLLDGELPEPDGVITNLRVTTLPQIAVVEWDTSVQASTQVLFRVMEPSGSISVTEALTHSLLIPLVTRTLSASALTQRSALATSPVLHHQMAITGLPYTYVIDFVALSRRLEGKACITSASRVMRAQSGDGGN